MSEKNNFSNVQRLNSAVMAKHEWTSSLIGMQKSGEEIHDRRSKTHRKANKFLQDLLQKRSDGSLIDDNGTIDRYHTFLKYKSNHDDGNVLDEFNRRLRALNANRRNQTLKNLKSSEEKSTPVIETENDTIQQLNNEDQSKIPLTSAFDISSENNQTNPDLNTNEHRLASSLNDSTTKTLHKPKARRADGTEIIVVTSESPLKHSSSNILLSNHCYFPRSLLFRERVNTNTILKKQLPSLPIEQFDDTQVFHLLDQLENKCTNTDFTTILDRLTLSAVPKHQSDNNLSLISDEDEDEENSLLIPNLFDQASLSQDYYKTLTINIEDPTKIVLYTMTVGTVQLSPSLLIPYSILNGRRPLLQTTFQTSFKQIRSKQQKHANQVTAIESSINTKQLKQNDILLKINNQSVWHLTIDAIRDILQENSKKFDSCSLTIARLCEPFL